MMILHCVFGLGILLFGVQIDSCVGGGCVREV